MTRYDQQILFTALAFLAVLLKDGVAAEDGGKKIQNLAKLFEDFCINNLPDPFSRLTVGLPSDADAPEVDAAIEQHIKDLRDKYETVLPQDLESLTKLHVRLQIRKIHRISAILFENVDAEKMADFVLSQINEEIEYLEGLS